MSLVLLAYAASRMSASNRSFEMMEAAKKEAGTTYYWGEDSAGRQLARVKASDPEYANFARIHTFQVGNNQPQRIPDKPFTPQKVHFVDGQFMTASEYALSRKDKMPVTRGKAFPLLDIAAGGSGYQTTYPGSTPAEQLLNNMDAFDAKAPHVGFTKPEGGYELFSDKMLEELGVYSKDKEQPTQYIFGGEKSTDFAAIEELWTASDRTQPVRQIDSKGKVSVAIAGIPKEEKSEFIVGDYTTNNLALARSEYVKNPDAGLLQVDPKGKVNEIYPMKLDTSPTTKIFHGSTPMKSMSDAIAAYNADPTKGLSIQYFEDDGVTIKDVKPLTGFAAKEPDDPKETTGFEYTVKTKAGGTVTFFSELEATAWRDENNPGTKIQKSKVNYLDGIPSSIGEMELLNPDKAEDKGQTQEVFLPSEKKYVPLNEFLEKATEDQVRLYELGGLKTLIRNADGSIHKYVDAKNDVLGKAANASNNAAKGLTGVSGAFIKDDNTVITVGYPADSKFGIDEQVDYMVLDYFNRPEIFKTMKTMVMGDTAGNPTAYQQWTNLLAGRIAALYDSKKTDPATGMPIAEVADLLNPVDDFAFARIQGLDKIPGIREALEMQFGVQADAERARSAAEVSQAAGTPVVIPQEIRYDAEDGTEMRFVADMPFPANKHANTLKALQRVGVEPNNIPNFVDYKNAGPRLAPVTRMTRSGIPYRVMADVHPRLQFIDQLESIPAAGGKTQLDTLISMITPNDFRAETAQIPTRDRTEVANAFMVSATRPGMIPGTVVRDPQQGMDMLMSLVPLSDTVSEKLFRRVHSGKNMQDVIHGAQASGGAATTAFQTLLNIEASYFMPDANGMPSNRMINMSMTEAKLVAGLDGILYFVDKAAGYIGGAKLVDIKDARRVADGKFASLRGMVMSPSEAAKADRGSLEANEEARKRNVARFEKIAADLTNEEIDPETGIAKNILATRKLYMYLAAYQMAAAIQGGTGGRTISDQDVDNMLAAFNFDGITTPEKELAAIRAAKSMMLRISVIDSAIGYGTNQEKHAALKYQELERAAGDAYRVTIYSDINAAASYLKMDGAEGPQQPADGDVEVTFVASDFKKFVALAPEEEGGTGGIAPSGIGTEEKAKAKYPDLYEKYMESLREAN